MADSSTTGTKLIQLPASGVAEWAGFALAVVLVMLVVKHLPLPSALKP